MSVHTENDETAFARHLADRVLDRPNADPDDELAVLSRQFLRARELADKYKALWHEARAAISKAQQGAGQ